MCDDDDFKWYSRFVQFQFQLGYNMYHTLSIYEIYKIVLALIMYITLQLYVQAWKRYENIEIYKMIHLNVWELYASVSN